MLQNNSTSGRAHFLQTGVLLCHIATPLQQPSSGMIRAWMRSAHWPADNPHQYHRSPGASYGPALHCPPSPQTEQQPLRPDMKQTLSELMRMSRICRMVFATCLGSFILVIFYFQSMFQPGRIFILSSFGRACTAVCDLIYGILHESCWHIE